jgi:hypothetical protein
MEYNAGNFEEAHRLFEEASKEQKRTGLPKGNLFAGIATMMANSARVVSLSPAGNVPIDERVGRILKARDIAKKRFDSCNSQVSAARSLASPLQSLGARWTSGDASLGRAALSKDTAAQAATMRLIFDTEVQTNQICGAPSGDDTLLLLLARSSHWKTMEP